VLQGRSKSKLTINIDNKTIEKTNRNYSERLNVQALKQNNFDSNLFKVPKIHSFAKHGFVMEYIDGKNFVEFFENSNVQEIYNAYKIFNQYFSSFSTEDQLINNQLIKKLNLLNKKSKYKKIIKNILKIVENNNISVPIGTCHGDLTFSNMVFKNEKIYLVDFLDSFIDSKIIDLIKIRQDTAFFWSLEVNKISSRKTEMVLKKLDEILYKKHKNTINSLEYKVLEIVNYLRIEPYLSDKKEADRLNIIIKFLIANIKT
tara:strand:- start:1324 stop:2100 length:777 start_codon:yes stop_codon:yes gene_type:complete